MIASTAANLNRLSVEGQIHRGSGSLTCGNFPRMAASRVTTRRLPPAERRLQVVAAAREVFGRRGYEGASVDALWPAATLLVGGGWRIR